VVLSDLKVRIGFSAGAAGTLATDQFAHLVDELERLGFDSVWVPEVITAESLDPLTALAFAAGRTTRLKMGSHLVVPGRNPARLAKELATLDQLSRGRLLLTFVIGLPEGPELSAQGVARSERTALLDETLLLLRRLWAGEVVSHRGRHFTLDEVSVHPRPWQKPLEAWYGGLTPAALHRCGELADGWIPGLIAPTRAASAREAIEEAAAAVGRRIDPEHFGANVLYATRPLGPDARARLAARNPSVDPDALVPGSLEALCDRLDDFVAAGFSKFVLRPADPPTDAAGWSRHLEALADAVLGRQTAARRT
jgi:probable F420-dependent oxidoreductase